MIPLIIMIELVYGQHIVFFVICVAQLPINRSARLRMVIVLHVHTFSTTIPFIMMILLLLQLECLLYVEPGHLDLVLDLDGIVNYLCLLLLLQHSLFTFNS